MAKNAKVSLLKDEDQDSIVRRFKREVNKAGVLEEAKKREFYLSPSEKRKAKMKEAQKRRNKKK